ncbi:MAG TPA: EAL domain-containing protein [Pyrinomonadaceae bacterium]|nr:EAL domain-containing protein [Pyrinomonadaceae bacterium]
MGTSNPMTMTMAKRPGILIIDDDDQVRSLLRSILAEEFDCSDVSSAEDAITLLKTIKFDLVASDINMGGISGLELVPYVVKQSPETVVVMISGQQNIDAAIDAMRAGAFDYIMKPFDVQHVEAAMRRALSHHQLLEDKRFYENNLQDLVQHRTAEVERLAYFDSLTDLPNRVLFEDRLTQALKHAQRDGRPAGLLLTRIDRFKEINDTLGHELGDRLLREIAERFRRCNAERGTLARFEGDDFALLLSDIHGSENVVEILRQLVESLRPPFLIDEHQLYITASIGGSMFPVDGESPQELLRNAAVALFRAQSVGGNNYQFYQAEMNARALERLSLEGDLRRAIQNGELRLHYQPQIDLHTNQLVGAESLVRWEHPKRGLLPPAQFVPLAEDTGLILMVGEWVLQSACQQIRSWQKTPLNGMRVSVNVSPRQLQQKHFVESVANILRDTQIDPATLQLEIIETSIMQSGQQAVDQMSELKQMGLMLAIDDFGVGYSSLGYLKRLPIDTLKIDRTFVSDATTDPDDAALVMAIITLAHNLRLKVMAEGVETEDQLRFLRLLRCDEGQGYLFGKPVSPETFLTQTTDLPHQQDPPFLNQPYSKNETERGLFRVVK